MLTTDRAHLILDCRCTLGEGIVWDERRQCLYWTDILSHRLWRLDPASGEHHDWALPEALGCLALCEDGGLLLALAKSLRRAAPPEPGHPLALTWLADVQPALGAATRSNDGRCDAAGNFVFGTKDETGRTPPLGRFFQYSHAHGLRELPLPPVAIPNAIGFSPDGRTLYCCDTVQPRILCADYDPDRASVANLRVFAEVDGGRSPDGATVDATGGLWNAHWDGGRVVRYAPDGRVDRVVAVPGGQVSCCAIGGPDLDTLYITTAREDMDAAALARTPQAGGLFAVALGTRTGRPEPRFRSD